MDNYVGQLLAAMPHLPDPNFARTVTLIVRQEEEEGSFGFVLNQPSDITIKEAWKQASKNPNAWECPSEKPVFSGGPVDWALTAVHSHEPLSEIEVAPGIYLCMKRKRLRKLIEEDHEFRIFSGCANWTPGQLEQEMLFGTWLVKPADKDEIFGEHYELWKETIKKIGNDFWKSIGLEIHPDVSQN